MDTPHDSRFYLVRELVFGESLADLVQKGWHPNEDEVKWIAFQMLQILHYLHSLRPPVISRDIKPQNIIRCQDGKVFLVDFGAAQDIYRNTLTRGGTFVGTIGYMPPEQFQGQVEPASDLYSLGATLLFLLTHRRPEELPSRSMKIDFRDRVQMSLELADWLDKILEPLVKDRFQSAMEALESLGSQGRTTSSLVQRRQKPKGSRVVLNRNDKCLVMYIPPIGMGDDNVTALRGTSFFFSLFLLGALSYALWSSVKAGNLESLELGFYVLAPFSVAFFQYTLKRYLFQIAGHICIEIEPENFRLHWYCFGFHRQVNGKTRKIKEIKLAYHNDIQFPSRIAFVMKDKNITHHFGLMLREVEKKWLVAELSDFLESNRL